MESHRLIEHIAKVLFEAERRRLQNWIDKLTRANQEANTNPKLEGFLYEGVYYRPSWIGRGVWPHGALHHSLADDMRVFLKDKKSVDDDERFIRQTLFALLYPCKNNQDIRDTLPECLLPVIAVPGIGLASLSRTRQPACTIEGNARALRQYEKILPKIELYTAARMMF
jgi:hypothetical protein